MDNSLYGKNKQSYTIDQAVNQLTKKFAEGWLEAHKRTDDKTLKITYAFPDWAKYPQESSQSLIYHGYNPNPSGLTAYQQQQAKLILQSWQDVANIELIEVKSTEEAMITFGNYHGFDHAFTRINPHIKKDYYGNITDSHMENHIWFNLDSNDNSQPALGNYGRNTYTHEIGHALGLSHPGNYESSNGGYALNASYKQDSRQYSVMSYWEETNTGASHHYDESDGYYIYNQTYFPTGPLMHDIAAIQKIHGANTTTRTGDTIYGFNSNSDRDFYTITNSNQKVVFCVWDAGGNDTLDFSGYYQNQLISLKEASFSDIGGLKANVSIARGAIIENAIGGSGNDVIIGNSADNIIEGGKGNDSIYGREGDDRIYGGEGNDIIYGGKGKDILWGGNRHTIMPDKKTDDQPPNNIHDYQPTQDVNNKLPKDGYDDELPQDVKDNELPQEDYDNEVTSIPNNCITSPWWCNNTNTCYWTTPTSCYSSTPMFYYPMMNNFNGYSYNYSSPWQYSITYNAPLPNQSADCNNYGYCNQQQATLWPTQNSRMMSNNYISNDVNNWYSDNKKPQKLDNGSGKDTFVFSSIEDSPYDSPDIIMDFETGIDKVNLSAIRLGNGYSTSNPDLYFVDYFTKQAGDVMLTYNAESNLSRLFIDGDGDAIPDFGLDIFGVVEQSDLILA